MSAPGGGVELWRPVADRLLYLGRGGRADVLTAFACLLPLDMSCVAASLVGVVRGVVSESEPVRDPRGIIRRPPGQLHDTLCVRRLLSFFLLTCWGVLMPKVFVLEVRRERETDVAKRRSFASKSHVFNPKFCPFLFFWHDPPQSAGPYAGPQGPAQDPAEHPRRPAAGGASWGWMSNHR
eukprot:scaffold17810_cov135-Isochrysis_galbana.AAC.2